MSSQNDFKNSRLPQLMVTLLKWKFEILLTLFLMFRIIYGTISQSKYYLFYDGYVEHASWIRSNLIQGIIPIENPFPTGSRNRMVYPFVSAIIGLFIPDIHVACALVNLFSNTICLILFYYLIIIVTGKKDVAFISTMIFGLLHPHMKYIWAGMTDSMGILFFLLSLIFLIRYYERKTIYSVGGVILFIILAILTRVSLGFIAIAPLINSIVSLIEDWRKNKDLSTYKGELIGSFAIFIIPLVISLCIFFLTNTFGNILWLRENQILVFHSTPEYNRELRNLLDIFVLINIFGAGMIGLIPGIQKLIVEKKDRIFLIIPPLGLTMLITTAYFWPRLYLPIWIIIIFIEIYGVKILLDEKMNSPLMFWFFCTFLIFLAGFNFFHDTYLLTLELPGL